MFEFIGLWVTIGFVFSALTVFVAYKREGRLEGSDVSTMFVASFAGPGGLFFLCDELLTSWNDKNDKYY